MLFMIDNTQFTKITQRLLPDEIEVIRQITRELNEQKDGSLEGVDIGALLLFLKEDVQDAQAHRDSALRGATGRGIGKQLLFVAIPTIVSVLYVNRGNNDPADPQIFGFRVSRAEIISTLIIVALVLLAGYARTVGDYRNTRTRK